MLEACFNAWLHGLLGRVLCVKCLSLYLMISPVCPLCPGLMSILEDLHGESSKSNDSPLKQIKGQAFSGTPVTHRDVCVQQDKNEPSLLAVLHTVKQLVLCSQSGVPERTKPVPHWSTLHHWADGTVSAQGQPQDSRGSQRCSSSSKPPTASLAHCQVPQPLVPHSL